VGGNTNLICANTVKNLISLVRPGLGHCTRLGQSSIMCILHNQCAAVKTLKYEQTHTPSLFPSSENTKSKEA